MLANACPVGGAWWWSPWGTLPKEELYGESELEVVRGQRRGVGEGGPRDERCQRGRGKQGVLDALNMLVYASCSHDYFCIFDSMNANPGLSNRANGPPCLAHTKLYNK